MVVKKQKLKKVYQVKFGSGIKEKDAQPIGEYIEVQIVFEGNTEPVKAFYSITECEEGKQYVRQEDEKAAKKYHEEYYKEHANTIKKQSANHEKCMRKVWKLYTNGKLSEECTNRISMELEVYSKRLKIRGKCR